MWGRRPYRYSCVTHSAFPGCATSYVPFMPSEVPETAQRVQVSHEVMGRFVPGGATVGHRANLLIGAQDLQFSGDCRLPAASGQFSKARLVFLSFLEHVTIFCDFADGQLVSLRRGNTPYLATVARRP